MFTSSGVDAERVRQARHQPGPLAAESCWRSTTSAVTDPVSASTRPLRRRCGRAPPGPARTRRRWPGRRPPALAARDLQEPQPGEQPGERARTSTPMTASRRRSTSASRSTRRSSRESPSAATAAQSRGRGRTDAGTATVTLRPARSLRAGRARRPPDQREHERGDHRVVDRGDDHDLQAVEREEPGLADDARRSMMNTRPPKRPPMPPRSGASHGWCGPCPAWNTPPRSR